MTIKAIGIKIRCKECGKEDTLFIPLVISEENWRKTQELHDYPLIKID